MVGTIFNLESLIGHCDIAVSRAGPVRIDGVGIVSKVDGQLAVQMGRSTEAAGQQQNPGPKPQVDGPVSRPVARIAADH